MIYFLLMLCVFAEGFLLWFLVALIREGRHLAPHTGKADRTRRGPVSRSGEPIPMNPGTTQEENAGKTNRKAHGADGAGRIAVHASTAWAAAVDAGSPQG